MKPAVSVLLPYRDVEETLGSALASVLAEREIDLEVIAIDDGSRDGSAEVVARWAARDPRVIPIAGEGTGIARALALGLRHARAEHWVARMDGDDISIPGRLAAQVEALARDPRLGAVGARVEPFPAAVVGRGLRRYIDWQNTLVTAEDHARAIFVEAPLCHPSVTLRREALEAVGGFREVDWPEDYDLWLRLDAAGWKLAKLPEVLLRWRQREGRLTFTDPRCALERHRALKAAFLAPRLAAVRNQGRTLVCWGAGPSGRRLARALEHEGVRFERWIDIDPRKVGRRARGAPIDGPSVLERGRDFVIVALGTGEARECVRADLLARGFVELEDFVCAS